MHTIYNSPNKVLGIVEHARELDLPKTNSTKKVTLYTMEEVEEAMKNNKTVYRETRNLPDGRTFERVFILVPTRALIMNAL